MHQSHGTTARTSERIRAAWGGGGAAYGMWSSIPDLSVAELVAGLPYDYVIVDLQHGVATLGDLPVLAQVMRGAGTAPLVRVPANDPTHIMRALDCGAAGVVVPLIGSAEEARAAADPCRFPPAGTRSWGPMWGTVRSDGARLGTISAGAPLTTSCAFVGPDLDVLLITSEASAPGFEPTALSGALFACTPGARGLPTRAWRATPMAPLP